MEEFILKQQEIKEKIVEVINTCGLPAFILKPIMKDFYDQLNVLESQQYQEALKEKQKKELAENKDSKLKKGENKDVNGNK